MHDPKIIRAVSHPTRIMVLRHLKQNRQASPNEMAAEFGIRLGNLSYHVNRLRDLGLLELVRLVPRRGATEHYYRLKPGVEPEESANAITHEILGRRGDARAGSRVLLDAPAIAALRPSVDRLFSHMRDLEADTVRRTAIGQHGNPFRVDIVFVVDADAVSGLSS